MQSQTTATQTRVPQTSSTAQTAALTRVGILERGTAVNTTISSVGPFPWESRPAMLARFGRAAEAALSKEGGGRVVIQAFELGNVRGNRRALKMVGLLILAPIWIPLFMILALVLAIPSMVYIPYKIWREWDEARGLGVSAGMLIFNIVLVIGFGYIGGCILALMLLAKVLPLGNAVVVARNGERVSVLYQQVPMLTFPQFRLIEHFTASDLSVHGPQNSKGLVLSLRRDETAMQIHVRRGPQVVSGHPEVNEANVSLLVGR